MTVEVAILMGSDSDLGVMQDAAKILEEFGISHEIHVMSAHRTPEAVVAYVEKLTKGGAKAFICGAGGAAHLAGVVAAHTSLPVIGVPIQNKSTGGVDALFATVQMPPGIPVAAVAIGGAKNAGILAAQIVGSGDAAMREKVAEYKKKLASDVMRKDKTLQEKGYKKYLEESGV